MSAKYKIEDAKKNKFLINEEVKVSKIKSKGGLHGGRKPIKKQKSTRDILVEFIGEQRAFNKSVMQRFDRQDKRFYRLENRINNLVKVNKLKE